MATLKESSGIPSRSSDSSAFITKLREHIRSNLNNEQFGVDSLAQAVGMSRSNLHRKLHKLLGISTSQFIREYRLERALEILKQGHVTASETAYRVGFSSPTYFNTSFHKFYGFTPGEVKSRSNEEIERFIHGKSTSTEKTSIKKRTLWVVLLVVAIISVAIYLNRTTSRQNEQVTEIQPTTFEKSIAVLPFKNWTGNPELEYVGDGMTDAVISRLAKISSIKKVIPFTSMLEYKGTEEGIPEIATALGVSNILQGNFQLSGNQIKINLQLIDGHSNNHFWTNDYVAEWKSDEIFEIQAKVAESIAKNMNASIAENEFEAIQEVPTKNEQAYTNFLQAEFQRNKASASAYKNAIPLYEEAIGLDSNFVEAHVGLANIWSFGGLVWGIYDEQEAWKNAKKLLRKALEIDSTNVKVEEELYTGYFYYDWNFELVEPYYQRISKQSYVDKTPAIRADYPIKTGRYEEAISALDTHILADPTLGISFLFKAEALMFLGRTDEIEDLLESVDPLYSDNWFYLRESVKLYYYLTEYKKSKEQLQRILTRFPDYPPVLVWFNAVYAKMEGNHEEAANHLAELHNRYKKGTSGSPAWFIALYHCTLEDYEMAIQWLQKSYERHEVEMTWLREEPLLAPIRSDTRYIELYENVGFSKIGAPIKSSSVNQSK